MRQKSHKRLYFFDINYTFVKHKSKKIAHYYEKDFSFKIFMLLYL